VSGTNAPIGINWMSNDSVSAGTKSAWWRLPWKTMKRLILASFDKTANNMIFGPRTAIYPAPDLQQAKKWYSDLFR
jgi:hypothetical protein